MTSVVSPDARTRRETFFRIIYGGYKGFVCISHRQPNTRVFNEEFFHYPEELGKMEEFIETFVLSDDVYYCPNLFGEKKRIKENVTFTPTLWADLDTCSPDLLPVEPSITIQSSPNRYQALWILDPNVAIPPVDAEDYCRRIAYAHADDGADKSGWDLTQLLRVPLTHNNKYPIKPRYVVTIVSTGEDHFQLSDFEVFPQVGGYEYKDVPFPKDLVGRPADEILQEFSVHFPTTFWRLYHDTPLEDWSKALWQVQLTLAESGMSREEMFLVASEAACNKYKRDKRSYEHLWTETCKAYAKVEERNKYLPTGEFRTTLPELLTEGQREYCRNNPTFVERYVEWGKTVGDAAWQYHQAGAMIVLSSLLAGRVRLPTSFGVVAPNLWFMILADTTLTRKTTAMDMAVNMLLDIDSDVIVATDGSIEGLMTGLSSRPGRPSLFLRDEFSGLLEGMIKKDYLAGMSEMFANLYDGKFQKRVLRKEVIEVKEPCLILFVGGIKSRILELLTPEQIASGFIPRFCIIAAESDVSNLRPLGPPTAASTEGREKLLQEVRALATHYIGEVQVTADGRTLTMPKRWNASLTDDAWILYNRYESQMREDGIDSSRKELATPLYDRLSKSGLKIAVLLAACRKLGEQVLVEEEDMVRAFFYIEQWRPHDVEILKGVERTAPEHKLERILKEIRKAGLDGVPRSKIMQHHYLTAINADQYFATLEQRGLIIRTKHGKAEMLFPVATYEGAPNGQSGSHI